MMTRKPTAWLPRNSVLARFAQLWVAAQAARAEWYCEAACRPVISSRTVSAASRAAATEN
jgi:hypothetical protein